MKTFVMGDVHGAAKAVVQCFERSGFDPKVDRLVFLGDVADGYPEVKEAIDLLLECENLVYILGNHDAWFRIWVRMDGSWTQPVWTSQGGSSTLESYDYDVRNVPWEHRKLLDAAVHYHIQGKKVFVHAGFQRDPRSEDSDILMWDRELWLTGRTYDGRTPGDFGFERVFLGHTQSRDNPRLLGEIWNLDSAAGYDGVLTIMNVDTEEFWQSDPTSDLYGGIQGR